MNKEKLIERIEVKKTELKKRKEIFLVMTNNEIDTSLYERNAISELLLMLELKSEIKELELQLLYMN